MPRGRPKGSVNVEKRSIAEAAKEFSPDALQTLVSISRKSASDAARVSAATALLDRAYGKPHQATTITGDPENPLVIADISNLELARRIAFLLTDASETK